MKGNQVQPSFPVRRVYCVLSPRGLAYSEICLDSLLRNSLEVLELCLITDSEADREVLQRRFSGPCAAHGHGLTVYAKVDLDARSDERFAAFPRLKRFRDGHPCWRKITDPVLVAGVGEEVVIIDPDVYFPNRFRFETTPRDGLCLMHQGPNCLLPEELVREVFEAGIPVADHTDIGVCQFRMPLPLDVLDTFLAVIDTTRYTWCMHVESVVWAALAMRMGGGYFAPGAWVCFANTLPGRIGRRFGRSPLASLASLPIPSIKAFHAGGVAKHWLSDAQRAGIFGSPSDLPDDTATRAFVKYGRAKFEVMHGIRRVARRARIYDLIVAS